MADAKITEFRFTLLIFMVEISELAISAMTVFIVLANVFHCEDLVLK